MMYTDHNMRNWIAIDKKCIYSKIYNLYIIYKINVLQFCKTTR